MIEDLEDLATDRKFRTIVLTITPLLARGDPVWTRICSTHRRRTDPNVGGARLVLLSLTIEEK